MSLPTIQESDAASERSVLDEPITTRHRPLYWRFRVSSLERSLDFLTHVFNMKILRHEETDSDAASSSSPSSSSSSSSSSVSSQRCSRTLVGLTSESQFCLELQYSYAQPAAAARSLSALRFITVKVPGAASRAKTAGWRVDTSGDSEALAVINGPDGMSFRCIENALSPSHADGDRDAVVSVSLSVADVDRSLAFYCRMLGMQAFKGGDRSSEGRKQGEAVQIGYDKRQTRLELVHTGQAAEQGGGGGGGAAGAAAAGEAAGRIAFSSSSVQSVYSRAKAAKADIAQAEAELIVLRDPDGVELCFISDSRLQRSARGGGEDRIDWQQRERTHSELDAKQAAGRREEKEEPQPHSAEAAAAASGSTQPAAQQTAVGRLVDESEFEEGGDNKQPATEAKQGDAAAADKQQQQQQQQSSSASATDARGGSTETTFITSSWISSPHEKVPSPAASSETGD